MVAGCTGVTVPKIGFCITEITTLIAWILNTVIDLEGVSLWADTFVIGKGSVETLVLNTLVLGSVANKYCAVSEHTFVTGEMNFTCETLLLTAVLVYWVQSESFVAFT